MWEAIGKEEWRERVERLKVWIVWSPPADKRRAGEVDVDGMYKREVTNLLESKKKKSLAKIERVLDESNNFFFKTYDLLPHKKPSILWPLGNLDNLICSSLSPVAIKVLPTLVAEAGIKAKVFNIETWPKIGTALGASTPFGRGTMGGAISGYLCV